MFGSGEYGADAFNAKISGEDQDAQAKATKELTEALVDGMAAFSNERWKSLGDSVGFFMAYVAVQKVWMWNYMKYIYMYIYI